MSGDSYIEAPRDLIKYPKGIPIKNLRGKKNFYVYSFNIKKQMLELKKVKRVWLSKKNSEIYEIKLLSGKKIKATTNHPFLIDIKEKQIKGCGQGKKPKIINRQYKMIKDLKVGDYLTTFNRTNFFNNKSGEYIKVFYNNKRRNILEHRFICEQLYGKLNNWEVVHHVNENKFNNNIKNLKIMNNKEHSRYHTIKRGFFGRKLWEKNGHPKGMLGKKHKEKTKKIISLHTSAALTKKNFKPYRKDYHDKEFLRHGFSSKYYQGNKIESIEKFKQTIKKTPKYILSERYSKNNNIKYSEKIISIKKIGNENVYDMEVEGNHNFIANNFILHNSGKTHCSIEIIKKVLEKEPEIRILIVVPKNVILESGWYKELYDAGISLKDIGVYYGNIKEYAKITITNMQNLDNIQLEIFGFICLDEIHNYATKRLLPYLKHPFKYKLGLSATVERMDNAHYQILDIFNYNVFKYAPKQALEEGVLNPFKFNNIGIKMDVESFEQYETITQDLNSIFKAGGGFSNIMRLNTPLKMKMLSKMNERKDLVNNYPVKFEVVKEICQKHKDDKVLIFNQYNKQTNKLYWYLLDVGIKARVIHSGIEKNKREQSLIDFRNNKFNVLLTTKVLDEGFNLPSIDCGIIMAGDSTAKQTIQRLGRVLRKKDKISTLYQIYCVKTIEEIYGIERAKLFKDLAVEYDEKIYEGEKNEREEDIIE